MSSLHKFKAYFGMVPSEDYDEEGYADGYAEHDPAFSGSSRRGAEEPAGYDSAAYEPAVEAPRSRPRLEPLSARRPSAAATGATRGALAMDDRAASAQRSESLAEGSNPLAKITTLNPSSYNEARTIGERYREGIPVIMNLTEMSDSDAKRLVDFAAGLAFAMRGSIDKVTNKVFLLSPSNVDVSAEVKRHIVENGFYNHS
ncbi:cell division protein SepF [Rhodococcus sp. X156]|uniref:cell division protein SepF n=1 Tax=Rhodococcus sp. X156 TaxID=2499145 RepID=UPI000FDBB1BF|nr:cell division protein SepF [Rhodococcus sp. X156]